MDGRSADNARPDVVREPEDRELSIGEFARWSRLPVSTLRYYHEIGVLEPARIDTSSGYRYYESNQLETAVLISDLRRLGMPPAEIAAVAGGRAASTTLEAHRRRLAIEIENRKRAVSRLDELLADYTRPSHHRAKVEVRIPSMVVSVSGRMSIDSAAYDVRRLVAGLRAQLRAAGAADPDWYGAMFPLDLESDPVEIVVYADINPPWPDSIPTIELPGGDYVCSSQTRSTHLTRIYADLLTWCDTNRRRPAGIVLEEYRANAATVAINLERVQ
jgi:DNA-binding transcriptional MerR regulator